LEYYSATNTFKLFTLDFLHNPKLIFILSFTHSIINNITILNMKKLSIIIITMFISTQNFAQSMLTAQQRTFAADYLQQTKVDFLKAIKGLTPEQLKFKTGEAEWSIADCVEHITVSEMGIFSISQKQLEQASDPAKQKEIKVDEQTIIKRLANRSSKAKSPEVLKPTGKFPSVEMAEQAFTKQRDSCITYVNTTNADLHSHYWQHPATGTIDIYQMIILMAAHSKRHTLQIEEIKTNPKFPKM
jgi:DinB superfamily